MQDAEILEGFIAEAWEIIDELEPRLIEFHQSCESGGDVDVEILNTILRLFHSLKGSSSFLELDNVTKVTHEAESLLTLFREGKFELRSAHTDLLCRTCDFVRDLLSNIEENGDDKGFETEAEALVEEFSKACAPAPSPDSATPQPEPRNSEPATCCSEAEIPLQRDNPEPETRNPEPLQGVSPSGPEAEIVITPEMKQHFIQESDELLEDVEQNLLDLEGSQENAEFLANAFRNIHSFKGNCGFLGYSDLERLSHKTETILDYMKEGKIAPEDENIKVLLEIVDTLRNSVAGVSEGNSDTIQNCDLMLRFLDDMIPDSDGEEEPRLLGEILVERGDATPEAVESALELQEKPLGEILVDTGATTPDAVESALTRQAKQETKKIIRRDIRVDLDKLDVLNDLVGELVIAQAMVIRNPDLEGLDLENFEKATHHLTRITSELQDVAMGVRMIPVSGLFRKMIRLVHDLSTKCGKKINLEMLGEETEIDKTVMELISDPLVHIIRNSVDHGVETVDERRASGKEETGTITIEAKHDGGEVWITIRDDGRGLNREKILAKAMERGLIKDDGTDMNDGEVFRLIFQPGFSTAAKVTDVSGRGVGMDVVRKNIDKLKGRVDIKSIHGQGTTIILRIPLTLAIIDGMLVRIGTSLYIIPLLAIKESFRPDPGEITVMPGGQEMVKLREELVPVVRFFDLYQRTFENKDVHDEGILVTLEAHGESVCLFVDEMLGQQETVIKGLPDYIGSVKGVSGCTILGGGDVSPILDVGGLLEKAKHC